MALAIFDHVYSSFPPVWSTLLLVLFLATLAFCFGQIFFNQRTGNFIEIVNSYYFRTIRSKYRRMP